MSPINRNRAEALLRGLAITLVQHGLDHLRGDGFRLGPVCSLTDRARLLSVLQDYADGMGVVHPTLRLRWRVRRDCCPWIVCECTHPQHMVELGIDVIGDEAHVSEQELVDFRHQMEQAAREVRESLLTQCAEILEAARARNSPSLDLDALASAVEALEASLSGNGGNQ